MRPVDSLDAAKGCVVGAFCGDATGGKLEFWKGEIDEALVESTILLPGSGTHKLVPGQITDDSEMALCLAHGITEVFIVQHSSQRTVHLMLLNWCNGMANGLLQARLVSFFRFITSRCWQYDQERIKIGERYGATA